MGKSTLLNVLTNAKSKVAAYEFTTLDVVPGVLDYKGARIQVLDLPGIIQGASSGGDSARGSSRWRGTPTLSSSSSMSSNPEARSLLEKELRITGIRVDENRPTW